jgi:hypothetical protein
VLDVVKEFYDGCGNLIAVRHVTIHYRFLGDQVVITRIFDDGQTHTTTITEDTEGYAINRNGYVYRVRFMENGVGFYDDQGNLIAMVTFNSDGTCTVTKPGEAGAAHVVL